MKLPPPAKKTIDLEGRLIKDGVRKAISDRQNALRELVHAIKQYRKLSENKLGNRISRKIKASTSDFDHFLRLRSKWFRTLTELLKARSATPARLPDFLSRRNPGINSVCNQSIHFTSPCGDKPCLREHVLKCLLSLVRMRSLNNDNMSRTGLDGLLDLELFELIVRQRHRCTFTPHVRTIYFTMP
jgi:hypothetical protein